MKVRLYSLVRCFSNDFSKVFIADLTCRAFMVAEENKRRTIQRSDIANAIARSDLFDFLIDIVPRSEMMRHRGSSVPIRNTMPAPSLPSPFPSADVVPRLNMGEAPGQPTNFLPLRPSQPDVRARIDPMEASLGLGSSQPLKGLPKAPMPNEWYPFPTAPMGDARMHPGASLSLSSAAPTAPPSARPMMGRGGVDATAPFMDANASLPMPPPHPRGSLLNMMPYSIDEVASKAHGNSNE